MSSQGGPDWSAHLGLLTPVEELAATAVAAAGDDARQDLYLAVIRSLAQFTLLASVDPSCPELVPSAGSVFNAACPNPDFVITSAPLVPDGVYRLSGTRGTTHFVTVTVRGSEIVEFDLDELDIAADGTFSVTFSVDPTDAEGADWRRLPPGASGLAIRQAAYGVDEVDGAFAIERLDVPVRPATPAGPEPAAQIASAAGMAPAYVGMWLDHVQGLRDRGAVNRLELDDWADRGGVAGQWYFQGIFELEPGQVLVLETDVPDCRYWNVQLSDLLWNAIDPMRHQCSLNGRQARLDGDGRFRAVVAPDDPGVPNWLDTAGRRAGTILGRWNRTSDAPLPTVRLTAADDVRNHLPADTPVVTPDERDAVLRHRLRAAQRRRRW